MTGRTLTYFLSLGLCACNCGEATTPAPHPLDPPAASSLSPSLSLAARCDELLTEDDVEEICGVAVASTEGRGGWDCERKFERAEDSKSRLNLSMVNELSDKQAMDRFDRLASEAKSRRDFTAMEAIGDGAHSFHSTYGSGDGYRRMPVLDTVSRTYVTRLRAPYHPGAEPVCEPTALAKLAKLVTERLSQASAK